MHPIIRPIVAIVGLMVAMGTAVATPRPVWVMGSEVLGETGDDGVAVFKGIPYAQAPVGRWRWRSPQPLTRLPSPFWATAWMPACPQSDSNTRWYRSVAERIDPNHGAVSVQAPPTMSEDCLGLNVWVPPHSPTDGPMAVLVWIHGGGHRDGYAYEPNYEGAALAKRGQLIVVSIAYRLNVLGFLPPRISNAPDLPLGMQDELAAILKTSPLRGNRRVRLMLGSCGWSQKRSVYSLARLVKAAGFFSWIIIVVRRRSRAANAFIAIIFRR